MSEPYLVHCPFCGALQNDIGDADNDAYFAKGSDQTLSVSCSACGAIGPSARTRAEAIAAWNAALAQSRADTQAALEAETEYRRKNHQLTNERDAALAGCVKIKPLFWAEGEFEDCIEANAYNIWAEANGYQVYFWSVGCGPRHPDQASAIEFAQWHHKARIRAAIQPDTSKLALVREALRFYAGCYEPELSNPNSGPWGANSTDFGEKARAALALITAQDEPRHD